MIRARTARAGLLAAAALASAAALAVAAPGDLSVVSLSSGGAQGTTPAEAAAVSADGRFVAFTSASDLAGVSTGGKVQLYVRDRTSGTTALASASGNGAAANQDVDQQDVNNVQFAISGDGRYVVFASAASNLTTADGDTGKDVFRKDMTTGAVTLVSVGPAGAKANAAVSGDPDVSADGSRVSFGSGAATNLFGADGNGTISDIVVRDIAAGTTTLAAQSTGGAQANNTTERSAISADGRVVTFDAVTGTSTLVPNEGTVTDIIVRNLATGTTSAASDPTAGSGSNFSDVSGDGRYVVFETGNKYDAANDASAGNDVYRRDMGTTTFVLVSAKNGSDLGGGTDGIRPQISADGGRVSFTSSSTDLTTDGNAAVKDVFVRDIAAKQTRLASVNGATQGSNDSLRSAIAANGGLVAFAFDDTAAVTKLIGTDANAKADVLAKELAPSDAAGPSLTLTGPAEGTSTKAERVAVGGTASDPSGIVSVTAGGAPLPVTGTGGFSTTVALALGANAVTVRAVNGAGNATIVTRTVTRTRSTGPGTRTAPRARITRLSVVLTRKGTIRVTLKLSAAARVRVTLLRSVKRPKAPRRTVLKAVGSPVTRTLKKGTRTVVLTPRRSLAVGRYVVRVRILSAAAGPRTRSVALRVRAR